MKNRSVKLEDVSIEEPCPASWAEMAGGEQSRYCDQCDRHVHNIAAMERAQAELLLASQQRGERLCLRLEYLPGGECITAETPQIVRTGPGRIAAAALALGMGLAACNSSGESEEKPEALREEEPCLTELLGSTQPFFEEEQTPTDRVGQVRVDYGALEAEPEEPRMMVGSPGPSLVEEE